MFKDVKETWKFPTFSCFLLRCFSDLSLVQKVDKNRALSAADAHAKKQKLRVLSLFDFLVRGCCFEFERKQPKAQKWEK